MAVRTTDEKIIELFFSRNESAIAEFERRYKTLCLRLARDITGNSESAEECLNDLYLKLWNSIPPEKPSSLKSYACRIIRNIALGVVEKQNAAKRNAVLVELNECVTEAACIDNMESGEIGAMIDEFLAAQPKVNALIFVRRYFYSDSVKNIAAKTGLTENKVSKILSKTRKELKSYLMKGGVNL